MNMRKAVAAAFGAALLGAGTGMVSGTAHGILSSNSTGAAKNVNKATGGTASANVSSSVSLDATSTLTSAVGAHQHNGGVNQNVHHKAKAGNTNGSTHGSAKSG